MFYSVDEYSKATPESQAQDVTTLSHYLTQPYSNDPISQLRSIYSWIAYHITYDVDEFFKRKPGGKKTPQAVLKDRTTVCAGYAILFEALCLANRDLSKLVQPRQVSGYGRGYGASTEMAQIPRSAHGYSNHAWNSGITF